MGYAVTNIGAQKLMWHLAMGELSSAIDIEIARLCVRRTIRCIEVNPPLIGLYRPGGWNRKDSDNIDKEDSPGQGRHRSPRENPMGERSVKTLMENIYGKHKA